MLFHGHGLYQWDTWYCLGPAGEVHAFYLQQLRPGSERSQQDADSIGHAVSTDLLDWQELPPAVPPSPPGEPGDLVNWTGSTIERDGTYYLFYTIRSSATDGREQSIGLATSGDLLHWEKHPDNPVLTPDPRWYNSTDRPASHGIVDCRDLMVVKHPERPGYFGVFATRVPTAELPQGAVFGGAYSDDLVEWEQTAPVFSSASHAFSIVEMPDLFRFDGRWYLTFLEDNSYGNRDVLGDSSSTSGTLYAVADQVEGPYKEPADNVLLASMGFNGISCRTVDFRGKKYVLYTMCERDGGNELRPTFGKLSLPKEVRLVDGKLRACFADLVLAGCGPALFDDHHPAPVADVHGQHETWGEWSADEQGCTGGAQGWTGGAHGWTGRARFAWARQSFAPVAGDVLFTARVTVRSGVGAGLVIRQQGTKGGVALLDVAAQRVLFATVPRFQIIDARDVALEYERPYEVRVLAIGDFLEVYLDDVLLLQFFYGYGRTGRMGLLVDRAEAGFTDVEARELLVDPAGSDPG